MKFKVVIKHSNMKTYRQGEFTTDVPQYVTDTGRESDVEAYAIKAVKKYNPDCKAIAWRFSNDAGWHIIDW
jgi:hypothetical protein